MLLANSPKQHPQQQGHAHPSSYGCSLFDRKADRSTIHFHSSNPTSPSQVLSIKDCGTSGFFSTWKISPATKKPSPQSKSTCKIAKPKKMLEERMKIVQPQTTVRNTSCPATTFQCNTSLKTHKCYQIERQVLSPPQYQPSMKNESIVQEFFFALHLNQQSNLMQQHHGL